MQLKMFLIPLAACATLATAAGAAESWMVHCIQVDDRKAVIATVEPEHQLPARARLGGTITDIKVKEGDLVAAGDRLALVVDPKLLLQMQALDSRIEAQQASRDQAKLDLDRAMQLRASGTVTQASVDQARTVFDIAERTLKAQRSEREVIVQQAAEGAVLAPAPGRLLKVPVVTGSVVMPGEPVAIIATDNYILRLQLPERHARFLKAGDTILIGARGLGDEEAEALRPGHVKLIYPEIDRGRVIADVAVEGLGDYFVGERTRVYVATGARDAFVVPAGFIHRRFGVSYVTLQDGTEVVVQPGGPAGNGIEILSGLADGDVVVKP